MNTLKRILQLWLSFSVLCSALSGCNSISLYRRDLQQGNIITPAMRAQLKPGLSKQQVQAIVGAPVLTTITRPNRWVYISTQARGIHPPTFCKRITLIFSSTGQLQRIIDP